MFFVFKDFGCFFFVQIFKGMMMRMWTVVIFASLPQAVNFFSKPSDQYYIVEAFLFFNVLQAIQSVQCTVRQKNIHHNSLMLHLMEAAV